MFDFASAIEVRKKAPAPSTKLYPGFIVAVEETHAENVTSDTFVHFVLNKDGGNTTPLRIGAFWEPQELIRKIQAHMHCAKPDPRTLKLTPPSDPEKQHVVVAAEKKPCPRIRRSPEQAELALINLLEKVYAAA